MVTAPSSIPNLVTVSGFPNQTPHDGTLQYIEHMYFPIPLVLSVNLCLHLRQHFNIMSLKSNHPSSRFAPLTGKDTADGTKDQLQGIVFDVDGTLW